MLECKRTSIEMTVLKFPINMTLVWFRAKIKNIEQTEEAKMKLMKDRMNKKKENTTFVPTNMAVNFVQHNRC